MHDDTPEYYDHNFHLPNSKIIPSWYKKLLKKHRDKRRSMRVTRMSELREKEEIVKTASNLDLGAHF